MRLFSLGVWYKRPDGKVEPFEIAHDLSTFGYFQRGSVKEFMDFSAKVVVERTQTCLRSSVKEREYCCHVYVRADNLAGVLIADQEYPPRVAQTLLSKVLEEFSEVHPAQEWCNLNISKCQYGKTNDYLQKYQNPHEADAMLKIQTDLDETKIILHNTMESILQRGEKLDDLVARSEGLSAQSKTFYTTAKKTNRCCIIL